MNRRIVAALLLLGLVLVPVAHGQSGRDGKLHELAVELVGRLLDGDQELLSFRLGNQDPPLDSLGRVYAMPTAGAAPLWVGIFRNAKPILSANAARVAIRAGQAAPLLIVRRMTAGSGDPRKVTVSLTEPYGANVTTGQACFTIGDTRKAPSDPDLRHKWLAAANDGLFSAPGAFREYARAKLDSMLEAVAPQPARRRSSTRVGVEDQRSRPDPRSLVGLMDTMSGLQSVHEALQTDRHLRTRYHSEPARVALSGLRGPELRQHPWTAMMAALGRAVPAEPLALAAPARFFYLRFASLTHLFRLLDEADTWITPAAVVVTSGAEDHDLQRRYQTSLGLARTEVGRILGPRVVTDLAVVGSDPYLREGTDLTLVFRLKSVPAFEAGLTQVLSSHEPAHGKISRSELLHAGVTIAVSRSADGAVHQHRAEVGEFYLVSNSPAAIKAVIDTIQKKAPALANQADFRYFLARDAAVPTDVLGFLSDAFIAEVVGPRQKILEARRMLAGADLLAPGYASLLFGWLHGKPPASVDEIVESGFLSREELRHAGSNEVISFDPGHAARSSWGSVGDMTPLIDRPVPTKVTETESQAYEWFADSYQNKWSTYVDPICLRVRLDPNEKAPIHFDLRVLPIVDASHYHDIEHTVGEARVDLAPMASGAWVSLGVGAEAELRDLIMGLSQELVPKLRDQLDWLGEVAFLGLEDRFNPTEVIDRVNHLYASGSERDLPRLLSEAPLHAGVAVKNRVAAGLTLSALRTLVQEAVPGVLDWGERGKERGVPYVAVSAAHNSQVPPSVAEMIKGVSLYYALCKDYLLLSLSERTLKARIADCLDGKLARPAAAGKPGSGQSPQLVVSLASKKSGPLWQLTGAGIAMALQEGQASTWASVDLMRLGAPGLDPEKWQKLSVAYFGGAPMDPEGGNLFARPGPIFASQGHDSHPRLIAPTDASLAGRLTAAFAKARIQLAFDDEPTPVATARKIQSLHVVLSTGPVQ